MQQAALQSLMLQGSRKIDARSGIFSAGVILRGTGFWRKPAIFPLTAPGLLLSQMLPADPL
ncbi:hypothetical protein CQA16_22930 [Enterobacter hormaechei]|nr:hypothetical protein CQA16_22930 [Enterobacter hormaechei]